MRVDWRGSDVSFDYDRALAWRALDSVRRFFATAYEMLRLVATIVRWWFTDTAHDLARRSKAAFRLSKPRLRLPRWPRGGDTWIVTVNMAAHPASGLEGVAARLHDIAVEMRAAAAHGFAPSRI